jgi:hypothetical protein
MLAQYQHQLQQAVATSSAMLNPVTAASLLGSVPSVHHQQQQQQQQLNSNALVNWVQKSIKLRKKRK